MLRPRTSPDLARAQDAIRARGGALGAEVHVLWETTSTNDEAKHAAKRGAPSGAVWVTESQTSGRGRQGRTWLSPPGENLLFSVLVRVSCPPSRLPPLALVAGLAARDAATKALAGRVDVKLKWPNDVVVGTKKLAGVLVESIVKGREVEALVIGVGMNVLTRDFPDEIRDRATSLSLCGGTALDRAEILADVVHALDRDLELVASRGLGLVHARLNQADALKGQFVRGDAGGGTAEGIDVEGRLLVRDAEGVLHRWSAGEVHIGAG